MTFTDLLFLFSFLPVSLCVYHLSKESMREYILLAISLIFYACGSFAYLGLLMAASGITILFGWLLLVCGNKKPLKNLLLAAGILYHVSLLAFYKYAHTGLVLPLGISYYTFKAISYLADVYMGKTETAGTPVRVALYLSFFPQVQSGPLSRYRDMRWTGHLFVEGACQFIHGFCKKVLLADSLAHIPAETFAADGISTAFAWLGAICYSLQLFYDFSGYSDMAAGISKMFGYTCPVNFQYPYMADSVSAFWRKWHITLGAWFRDYIYIPLGGSQSFRKGLLYRNLFAVWMLTGIWHGAGWNFVLWGFVYFIMIAFEKTTGMPQKIRSGIGKMAYRMLTLLIVLFQWVMFRSQGFAEGIRYLKQMVCFTKNPLTDRRALFLLKDYLVFIFAAVLFCFPLVPWLEKRAGGGKNRMVSVAWNLADFLLHAALLVWALSFVVSGQNEPFAYRNF